MNHVKKDVVMDVVIIQQKHVNVMLVIQELIVKLIMVSKNNSFNSFINDVQEDQLNTQESLLLRVD